MRKTKHEYLKHFNPQIIPVKDVCQNFYYKILAFNAGEKYKDFNDFIKNETEEFANSGDGVTYTVWDLIYNENEEEIDRKLIAYYSLSSTAIPFEDRIRNDEDEIKQTGQVYDSKICGIPSIEIKIFAVDHDYQDIFYQEEHLDMPVAAWVLYYIINHIQSLQNNVIGFKAIFLQAIPEAESFYLRNGFDYLEENMHPFHNVDSDCRAMYIALKSIHMNYDL